MEQRRTEIEEAHMWKNGGRVLILGVLIAVGVMDRGFAAEVEDELLQLRQEIAAQRRYTEALEKRYCIHQSCMTT